MPRHKSFETFYPRYWRVYLATCPLAGLLFLIVITLSLALDADSIFTVLGSFTCLWLPCQQMLALLLMMNWRISIDNQGVGEYDIFNSSKRLYWNDVDTAHIHYLVGFPVLIIKGYRYRRVRIPLFMYSSDKMIAALYEFAGPDHPVTLAAVDRYRDED